MPQIHVLSSETVNRIAAGEVVERPANVVKELVENAIDAGADAVTVEIRNGGMELIRVTDNGCGIEPSQVRSAFLRHATSKIENAQDLTCLSSLGFRGEALSSIAAVARVEMITKTAASAFAVRAENDTDTAEGAGPLQTADHIPLKLSEIGAPDGTTVMVRDLFYNVPVRRKFLKTPQTEGLYISDLVGHFALSHPEISFHFRMNGQERLHTTGNGNIRELIYRIYGRDLSKSVIPLSAADETQGLSLEGFLGRPEFSRSSRSAELFFVNGRILRSDVLSRGLEEGYRTDLMQHRFPFAILYLSLPADRMDVNVHPSKMEIRFLEPGRIYDFLQESVHRALGSQELIPHGTMDTAREEEALRRRKEKEQREQQKAQPHLEPFERGHAALPAVAEESHGYDGTNETECGQEDFSFVDKTHRFEQQSFLPEQPFPDKSPGDVPMRSDSGESDEEEPEYTHDRPVLTPENARQYRYVGQLFATYWIIEFEDKMLLIDQHAAHEKVNFERLMRRLGREQESPAASQLLAPPIVVQLTGREEAALAQYLPYFQRMGYEIEPFGDHSHAIRSVPLELYANKPDELLIGILDEMADLRVGGTPDAILYKIASMSCKAAVKGNTRLSEKEARALIDELLQLDNPYHCPHGRPTMIVMSRHELDRKFQR